jgi:hypothetical protein
MIGERVATDVPDRVLLLILVGLGTLLYGEDDCSLYGTLSGWRKLRLMSVAAVEADG